MGKNQKRKVNKDTKNMSPLLYERGLSLYESHVNRMDITYVYR